MRICYYGKSLTKLHITGVERVAEELLRAMAAQPGVEIIVLARRFARTPDVEGIIYRRAWWLNDLSYSIFFGLVARLLRCDRMLTTLSLPCLVPLGLPQAVCIHDLAWKRFPERFTWLQLAYFHAIHRASAWLAQLLYCPSQATADDLKTFFRPAGHVAIVPWGADHLPSAPPDAAIELFRQRFGIDLTLERVVVTIGTLQPRKGYAVVLDAIARARSPLLYVIVGRRGWLADEVVSRIQNFEVTAPPDKRVVWIDDASDEIIASILSAARLFVLASDYEGFGLPVVEAMRAGCPVAVADNSSLRELIDANQPSFSSHDADALVTIIDRVFDDPQFASEQRSLSINRSNHYRWAHSASLLTEFMH